MGWRFGGGRKERKWRGFKRDFLKWVLRMEWGTPGYMVREELQREKFRVRAGKRTWGFKKRLEEGRGSSIA